GRLGQDVRVDRHALVACERRLRRILKVTRVERIEGRVGRNMTSLVVVNLHGLINTPSGPRKTLIELGIGKRFAATVVQDDPSTMGALELCKEYVAWSPIDADLLASLLKAR